MFESIKQAWPGTRGVFSALVQILSVPIGALLLLVSPKDIANGEKISLWAAAAIGLGTNVWVGLGVFFALTAIQFTLTINIGKSTQYLSMSLRPPEPKILPDDLSAFMSALLPKSDEANQLDPASSVGKVHDAH